MYSVLFVCTANICRSPMAAGLLRDMVDKAGQASKWRIDSAGTWAPEGEPAAQKTLLVLQDRGIAIGGHRSKSVSRELLAGYNLILTMEGGHKEALRIEFPEARERIYLLSEMIGQQFDVHDPIGASLKEFQETASDIGQVLERGFERIQQLAKDAG